MPRSISTTIKCPECGMEQKVVIWSSINVTIDPTLRDKLFQGGNQSVYLYRVSLHSLSEYTTALPRYQPGLRCSILSGPIQCLDDPQFIDLFAPDNPPHLCNFSVNIGYLAQPHIVFNMDDLLFMHCLPQDEKIRKAFCREDEL
jgi:hypothetical protein